MSGNVYHICAYKVSDPTKIPDLITAVQAVNAALIKPDGTQYLISSKGGKQMSPEGFDHGTQLVFVLEFKDDQDLMYYINEDPAHVAFKTTCVDKFGLDGGMVVDFVDGAF